MHRYVVGCLVALLLVSCGERETDKHVALVELPVINLTLPIVHSTNALDYVEIKNWLVIGPFEFRPIFTDPVKTFFRKDLKRYGIKEGFMDNDGIKKLQKKGVKVFSVDMPSPQIKFFDYVSNRVKNKSNFYLSTQINSDKPQDATLIIDGSNSYAVWLNGEELISVRGKYNTNKAGDRFVSVSLEKGLNTLFVKVNRSTNMHSWDFMCAIAMPQTAERIFSVNYAGDFVTNPIIDRSLEIYAGPYPSGKVEVVDRKNQVIVCESFDRQNTNHTPFSISGLDKIPDGFYKAILTVGNHKLEEMVYKGDYDTYVKEVKSTIAGMNDHSLHAEDVKAAMERVDFLKNKRGDPNSSGEMRDLNRNRVFWGYALHRMLTQEASTQLMTYKKERDRETEKDKDNDQGTFVFHLDAKLKQSQQPVPLVVIVPSALNGSSMIEDWYLSNLDQIEADNALASTHEFAVAWIYAEGKKYSAEKTEKEITAVIDRLQSEYPIDSQRIFIMGDCEGGRRALVQLTLSPNRYAACCVSAPITLSGGNDGTPVKLLPQMSNIPIMLRHGVDDDVSSVENSRKFYGEAQKLNLPVTYVETAGSHKSIEKDYHRAVFDFFSEVTYMDK